MTVDHWLSRIFEQAPVAIALLEGSDYRLKLANDAMYEIWQLPAEHEPVIGQPVFEAFPAIAGIGLEELLADVRRTKQSIKGSQAPYTSRDNRTAYVDFVYAPIYDDAGNLDIVVVATEVTQQVHANQRLKENEDSYRQLAEKLAESNRALASRNDELARLNQELAEANGLLTRSNENLQRFSYVASHDLQEPLRKIQQFGDLLNQHHANALGEGQLYVERMQSAASRMSTLIRDLLSYSRITTQRDKGIPVALNPIVDQVLTTLEWTIQETGAQIQVEPLPTLWGDGSQLGQLFQNLLSNALKFRRTDTTPRIQVRAQTVAAKELPRGVKPSRGVAQYHRLDVQDNGVGFDEQYLDRIFQMFQRLHGKNEFAGTGIGLAICEKVVTNHGGAITASSQPGQGATFSVYLPTE